VPCDLELRKVTPAVCVKRFLALFLENILFRLSTQAL